MTPTGKWQVFEAAIPLWWETARGREMVGARRLWLVHIFFFGERRQLTQEGGPKNSKLTRGYLFITSQAFSAMGLILSHDHRCAPAKGTKSGYSELVCGCVYRRCDSSGNPKSSSSHFPLGDLYSESVLIPVIHSACLSSCPPKGPTLR